MMTYLGVGFCFFDPLGLNVGLKGNFVYPSSTAGMILAKSDPYEIAVFAHRRGNQP